MRKSLPVMAQASADVRKAITLAICLTIPVDGGKMAV